MASDFGVAPPKPGLDLSLVLSDGKHYSSLICAICTGLVSLDAVVTSSCSHPFCRGCLHDWTVHCNKAQMAITCPMCKSDLSPESSLKCMKLGTVTVAAQPLQEAQPLAYTMLTLVQVACIHDLQEGGQCDWCGDYGKFPFHLSEHCVEVTPTSSVAEESQVSRQFQEVASVASSSEGGTAAPASPDGGEEPDRVVRPAITPKRSNSSLMNLQRAELALHEVSDTTQGDDCYEDFSSTSSKALPRTQAANMSIQSSPRSRQAITPKRSNSSLMTLQRAELALHEVSDTSQGGECSPDCSSSCSPWLPRKKVANMSIQSSPRSTKPRLPYTTDSPKNKILRKQPGIPPNQAIAPGSITSSDATIDDDILEHAESDSCPNSPMQSSRSTLARFSDSELEVVDETEMNEDDDGEETITELELDSEDEETTTCPEFKTKKILERAEKLKKQANAKFNKGDFTAARALYTEGINVMAAFKPVTKGERELMSNMHSNRAVTFFREKEFQTCIDDCEKAIGFDPTYDKSWVRKWRALVAVGKFETAHVFIEEAARALPSSSRIEHELKFSRADNQIMKSAAALMEAQNYVMAKQRLVEASTDSTNPSLLCMAAHIDVALGHSESAIELTSKALRLNPQSQQALELQGVSFFLSGDTEKGAHVLYKAYCLDQDSPTVKSALTKCQKTHAAASQARSSIKRGMYEEASRHFTTALKESSPLPKESPLLSMLLAERAEAWLLSTNYLESLKDCQEIFNLNLEHAGAWVIRSEVLIALGKANEAKMELAEIRQGWGAGDPTIEAGYRRVDFELRVAKADEDLLRFVSELESGNCQRLVPLTCKSTRRPAGRESSNRTSTSSHDHSNHGARNRRKARGERGSFDSADSISSSSDQWSRGSRRYEDHLVSSDEVRRPKARPRLNDRGIVGSERILRRKNKESTSFRRTGKSESLRDFDTSWSKQSNDSGFHGEEQFHANWSPQKAKRRPA